MKRVPYWNDSPKINLKNKKGFFNIFKNYNFGIVKSGGYNEMGSEFEIVESLNEKYYGNHKFLAEELLIPNVNKADSNRVNMFTNHIRQAVILKNGEFPRVFTNFENQVGKYSSAFKVADRDWKIVSIIKKNQTTSIFVIKDKNGFYDIIWRKPCERVTEYFGYSVINSGLDSKKCGSKIEKGEIIHRSTSYDENGNFQYGVNLKALYIPWKNMTFEDAIVISESAANKLTSYMVEEIMVMVNDNDLLINIYGDTNNYKSFPDIGEKVKEKILLARRRINYNSILFDLSVKNLSNVNYSSDTVFYSEGTVVDIDVLSNNSIDNLKRYPYNIQIVKYLQQNLDFHNQVSSVLGEIIKNNPGKYSDDLAYRYKRSKDIVDPEVRWKNQKNDFNNLIVKFVILKEQKLAIGSKLTGRYGNKGCISTILPDEEMPISEDGQRAEILLNPLGVINRLNPAQLYEQEINFISNYIVGKMKEVDPEDPDSKAEILLDYINDINPQQAESMINYYNELDYEKRLKFIEGVEGNGIFIHQPPFFGNITFDQLKYLYDKYPDCRPLKFEGIEKPLILGELYFIKLKHEASSKFSARSSSYLNLKNIPSKSTRFKENQQLYPKTPIKIGEMELMNLYICNQVDEVTRFLAMYSSNEEDRVKLIETLLKKNVFDLDLIERTGKDNRTRMIIDVMLKSIGLRLLRRKKK
jgi:DNA-directed RNA polymerase beta subunit